MAIDWDQVAGLGGNDGAVADFVKKTRFEHGDIENAPTVHLVRLLDACRTQLNAHSSDEVKRLQADNDDLRAQVATQRELVKGRVGDDSTFRDQLRQKNRDLSDKQDALKTLELRNMELEDAVQRLTVELGVAAGEMDGASRDHARSRRALEDALRIAGEAERERDAYQAEVGRLNEQMEDKDAAVERVLAQLSDKVDKWNNVLAAKDEEIQQGRRLAAQLEEDIAALDGNADEVHALREGRDAQVVLLQQQLKAAVDDLDMAADDKEELYGRMREAEAVAEREKKAAEAARAGVEDDMTQLERQLVDKEEELLSARARLLDYEKSTFGLYEAMQEIKEKRTQIELRDATVQELTRAVNEMQERLDKVLDENQELRRKVGVTAQTEVDIHTVRTQRAVELEQVHALNRELQREVDQLEEERVQLREQLRAQALHRGERAVELGLTTEDLVASEQLVTAQQERRRNEGTLRATRELLGGGDSVIQPQLERLTQEIARLTAQVATESSEQHRMRDLMHELEQENRRLRREGGGDEATSGEPRVDPSVPQMRRELAALRRENEQLRQTERAIVPTSPPILSAAAAAAATPTAINDATAASLASRLATALNALDERNAVIEASQGALEQAHSELAMVREQHSLVYAELRRNATGARETLEQERRRCEDLDARLAGERARVSELSKLQEVLSENDDEVKRRVAALSRENAVLIVNETQLRVRYSLMAEREKKCTQECQRLRANAVDMERTVRPAVVSLRAEKERLRQRVRELERTLDGMVPAGDVDEARRLHQQLSVKYAKLLDEGAAGDHSRDSDDTQGQRDAVVLALRSRNEQLEQEIDRFVKLASESLRDGSGNYADSSDMVARRVAALELAHRQSERDSIMWRERHEASERRCQTLEEDLRNATRQLLKTQEAEQTLQREFEGGIGRQEYEALLKKLTHAEEATVRLTGEAATSRALAEAAAHEHEALEELRQLDNSRVRSLHERLEDLAAFASGRTEAAVVIARIEAELESVRVELMDSRRQLNLARAEGLRSAAHERRLAQRLIETEFVDWERRHVHRAMLRRARKEISLLRSQYVGTVASLDTREALRTRLKLCVEREERAGKLLREAGEQQMAAAEAAAATERERELVRGLVATFGDGPNAANLMVRATEWHEQSLQAQLENMRMQRRCEHLAARLEASEGDMRRHEEHMAAYEERVVQAERERHEERAAHEHRVQQLEKRLEILEAQRAAALRAVVAVEDGAELVGDNCTVGSLDEVLPQRLGIALQRLEEHAAALAAKTSAMESLQSELTHADQRSAHAEEELSRVQRQLNETKIALARHGADETTDAADWGAQAEREMRRRYEEQMKQQRRVAQDTVDGLRQVLERRETAIGRYEEKLAEANAMAEQAANDHEREVRRLEDRLREAEQVGAVLARQRVTVVAEPQMSAVNDNHAAADDDGELRVLVERCQNAERASRRAEAARRTSEQEIERLRRLLEDGEDQASELKRRVDAAERESAVVRARERRNKKSRGGDEEMRARLEERERQVEELAKTVRRLHEQQQEQHQKDERRMQVEEEEEEEEERRNKRGKKNATNATSVARCGALESELEALQARVERINEDCSRAKGREKTMLRELERVGGERDELKQRVEELSAAERREKTAEVGAPTTEEQVRKKNRELRRAHDQLAGVRQELEEERGASEALRQRVGSLGDTVRRLEREKDRLGGQVRQLERAAAQAAAAADGPTKGKNRAALMKADVNEEKVRSADGRLRADVLRLRRELGDAREEARAANEKVSNVQVELERERERGRKAMETVAKLRVKASGAEAQRKQKEQLESEQTSSRQFQQRCLELERQLRDREERTVALEGLVKRLQTRAEDGSDYAVLIRENARLKSELDAFSPEFFAELEQLKVNCRLAVEKNREYERRLENRV